MSQAIVTLKKGEGRLLKSGGAWVFDNEIASIVGEFENGDIVIVHDYDGYGMGRGFINMNSKIRIRMMTRKVQQEIDEEFLQNYFKNEVLKDKKKFQKQTETLKEEQEAAKKKFKALIIRCLDLLKPFSNQFTKQQKRQYRKLLADIRKAVL